MTKSGCAPCVVALGYILEFRVSVGTWWWAFCWLSFLFRFDFMFVSPSRNTKIVRVFSEYALVWGFYFLFLFSFPSYDVLYKLIRRRDFCLYWTLSGFSPVWHGKEMMNLSPNDRIWFEACYLRSQEPKPGKLILLLRMDNFFFLATSILGVIYKPVIIECFHVQFAMMILVRSSSTDLIMGAWYLHMPKIPLNWAKLSFSLLLTVFLCSATGFVPIMEP